MIWTFYVDADGFYGFLSKVLKFTLQIYKHIKRGTTRPGASPDKASVRKMKLLLCLVVTVLGLNQARYDFEAWIKEHKKIYESDAEKESRFVNWQSSVAKVENINRAGLSWTAGLNKFSDLTWDEFKAGYLMEAGT